MKKLLLFLAVCFNTLMSYSQSDLCTNATLLGTFYDCSPAFGSMNNSGINTAIPGCTTTASQDVWYKFVASQVDLSITVSVLSGSKIGMELFQGSCNGQSIICRPPDLWQLTYYNNNFVVGQTYYIRLFNALPATSPATFTICCQGYNQPPSNDYCTTAAWVGAFEWSGYYFDGNLYRSTPSNYPSTCSQTNGIDMWYRFVAPTAAMSVYFTGSSNGFEILQGSCNGPSVICNNNSGHSPELYYFNDNFVVNQEYFMRVFSVGSPGANGFSVRLTKFPTPANDLCANAGWISPTTECRFSQTPQTLGGTTISGTPPTCALNASQDIWYKFVATKPTMSLDVTSIDSGWDHGFEIFQGNCAGTNIACVNAHQAGANTSESYMNNNFIVGTTYYVRVFNATGGASPLHFTLCLKEYLPPPNDLCANATSITPDVNYCFGQYGNLTGAGISGNLPSCEMNTSQDVWYKFVATDKIMKVRVQSTPGMEIFEGSCVGSNIFCSANDDYENNNFTIGQTYYIRVFNAAAYFSWSFSICVQGYPPPANDLCANAALLDASLVCTPMSGTFLTSDIALPMPSSAPNASQDVWYKFIANTTSLGFYLRPFNDLNLGFEIFEGSCNGTNIISVNSNPMYVGESAVYNNLNIGATYYIRVFNADAIVSTRTFSICTYDATLGTTQEQYKELVLYPNPADDMLTIDGIDVNEKYTFEIVNNLGQLVQQNHMESNIKTIDIKGLNSGIYILKLHIGYQDIKPTKFIKK